MNRVPRAMFGWVALPVHQEELESLLEALCRGADLMVPGPRRAAAFNVTERLRSLHRELSRCVGARAGSG